MNTRLNHFLATEHLSPTRFADEIGVQRSGISHILSGRNKPRADFLEKFIKRFPAVNIEWFLTGRGNMYKEMSTPTLFPAPPENQPQDTEAPHLCTGTQSEPATQAPLPVNTVLPQANEDTDKQIEKIVFFYTDHTFSTYRPAERSE
jgi:transcriptional regulator with XRE-family HTH domain